MQLVPVLGKRVGPTSIYTPGQNEDFKLSRGKFNDFLTCPRCFYMDRVLGFTSPGTLGWTLNETTDNLLKKEFDICRKDQIPHRLCVDNGMNHVVPFDHPDMDKWRDSLRHDLIYRFGETNIILSGGVDDIWQDTNTKQLIVVDYKSQAKNIQVETEAYLSDVYHGVYKIQMDFYAYLLTEMGFEVFPTAYFYVCNVDRHAEGFFGEMKFYETLVTYDWDVSWIPKKVQKMIDLMNSIDLPRSNESCENCAYALQRASHDLLLTE